MHREEKVFKFKIMGPVKAKQSVKVAHIGDFMKKYTPSDVKMYANWVKHCFMMQYKNHTPDILNGYYIDVKIDAYRKIPASFSEKKKEMALLQYIRPDKKPDWDNISKNICDALNGIAYFDDKGVVDGEVHKYYAAVDYVNVTIKGFRYVE